ncbi:hypothetical protein [Vibrio phage phiKT1028]|nr:hypothetical protein [Vibrio phage phiKT1028]
MAIFEAKQYSGALLLQDLSTDLFNVLKYHKRKVNLGKPRTTLVDIHFWTNTHFRIELELRGDYLWLIINGASTLSSTNPNVPDVYRAMVDITAATEIERVSKELYTMYDTLFEEHLTLSKQRDFRKFMIDNVAILQHPIHRSWVNKFFGDKVQGEYTLSHYHKVLFVIKDRWPTRKATGVFRFIDRDLSGNVHKTEMTRGEVYNYEVDISQD